MEYTISGINNKNFLRTFDLIIPEMHLYLYIVRVPDLDKNLKTPKTAFFAKMITGLYIRRSYIALYLPIVAINSTRDLCKYHL